MVFTGICAISAVLLDYMVVETKGKTENQIAEEYAKGKYVFFNLF